MLSLLLFGIAFGYLEAAVVSYLRALHEPARQRFYPGRPPGELFPLLTIEQAQAAGPEQPKILIIEIGREAATIVMLAAIALAVADNAGQWAAAFAIAFGTWDIAFYAFLKVLLDWPAALSTWDILFLIPIPWVGPVLAPVIVSASAVSGVPLKVSVYSEPSFTELAPLIDTVGAMALTVTARALEVLVLPEITAVALMVNLLGPSL